MPPTRRGRRSDSGPFGAKPLAFPLRSSSESSVKGGGNSSSGSCAGSVPAPSLISGSKSKASEAASHSVTRSVSSSSSLSAEVSSGGGYTSGFDEEFGLNPDYDSDGQSGGFELDERGKQFASIADSGYTSGFEEEFRLNFDYDSDGQSGGFELDERGKQFASIESGDPLRAALIVYPKGFVSFEDKSSAINADTSVDKKLVDMINRWNHPGMSLCVGKPEYKAIIESVLKIPCMCCETVMEIMWGIQQQMSVLVPREKSKLTKEDRLPMSQGLIKFLSHYGFDVKPEMVNEKIFLTACALFHCDVDDEKNLGLLRDAGLNIRDISGIACGDWDILKLAIAVKVICFPEEELTDFHEVLAEDVVSKLKGDAHKYKGNPVKVCWLRAYKAAVSNHHLRIAKKKLLGSLVKKAKKVYEAEQAEVREKGKLQQVVRRSPRLNTKLYEKSMLGLARIAKKNLLGSLIKIAKKAYEAEQMKVCEKRKLQEVVRRSPRLNPKLYEKSMLGLSSGGGNG